MIVGFDSDGVLYRFTKAYHTWMNLSQGLSLDPEVEAQTWDWFEEFGQTVEQFKKMMDEGVDAGHLFWQGELYEPEIVSKIADLRSAGHEVHLVTHRFSGKTRCSQDATKHFYDNLGIKFDSIIFSKDKTVLNADVFIEDNVANYDALEAAGTISYLVNRPYNVLDDNRRRVNTVTEFCHLILESSCLQYSSF